MGPVETGVFALGTKKEEIIEGRTISGKNGGKMGQQRQENPDISNYVRSFVKSHPCRGSLITLTRL